MSIGVLGKLNDATADNVPPWSSVGDNLREVAVLVGTALICLLYYVAESARPIVLQLFFLPVVVSALTLGRYRSCLVAVLCLVFVVGCGIPPTSLVLPGLNTAVWSAILSLTAILTGGLCDEKNRAMDELWKRNKEDTFRDELTQIANRRAFNHELTCRVNEYDRHPGQMAMVLIDVDRFKQFNDRFGHPAGDAILQQLAKVLEDTVRKSDIVARYGGEEFALLLPHADAEKAQIVAEKVRSAVESHWFSFRRSRYRITVSVGVSNLLPKDDIDQLTKRTDAALYTSKQSGRNCAHYHDGCRISPFGDRLPTAVVEKDATEESPNTTTSPLTTLPTSLLDGETGLPRRDVFTNELVRRVAEVHRYGGAISVMLVQVVLERESLTDDAKNLVRSVAAECITNLLRTTDQGTQYSELEFAIMLPCTELSDALIPALRLRKLVNDCEKPIYQGQDLEFSVSVGVAKVTSDDKPGPLMQRLAKLAKQARAEKWGVVSDQVDASEIDRVTTELGMTSCTTEAR